jgi:hypothetical protein
MPKSRRSIRWVAEQLGAHCWGRTPHRIRRTAPESASSRQGAAPPTVGETVGGKRRPRRTPPSRQAAHHGLPHHHAAGRRARHERYSHDEYAVSRSLRLRGARVCLHPASFRFTMRLRGGALRLDQPLAQVPESLCRLRVDGVAGKLGCATSAPPATPAEKRTVLLMSNSSFRAPQPVTTSTSVPAPTSAPPPPPPPPTAPVVVDDEKPDDQQGRRRQGGRRGEEGRGRQEGRRKAAGRAVGAKLTGRCLQLSVSARRRANLIILDLGPRWRG